MADIVRVPANDASNNSSDMPKLPNSGRRFNEDVTRQIERRGNPWNGPCPDTTEPKRGIRK